MFTYSLVCKQLLKYINKNEKNILKLRSSKIGQAIDLIIHFIELDQTSNHNWVIKVSY